MAMYRTPSGDGGFEPRPRPTLPGAPAPGPTVQQDPDPTAPPGSPPAPPPPPAPEPPAAPTLPEPPVNTPAGIPGSFASPANPASLTQFRTPQFAQNRVMGGGGGGAFSLGVPLVGTGPQPGESPDDEFRRIVAAIIRSRR